MQSEGHPEPTFGTLNAFVDRQNLELAAARERFLQQVGGLDDMTSSVTSTASKLEALHDRLAGSKAAQQEIEKALCVAESFASRWEEVLRPMEAFFGKRDAEMATDTHRSRIYGTAEDTSEVLMHMGAQIADLEGRAAAVKPTESPEHVAFAVIDRNLQILEQIYGEMVKLQERANVTDLRLKAAM